MKRFVLFFLFLSIVSIVSAQSRYWVGAPGDLWSSAASWSTTSGGTPGASSPGAADDVIFDNSFVGTITYDVASVTVKSVTARNPTNIILSLAGTTGRTLTCNNGGIAAPSLLIEPGATFTMTTATDPVNFTLAFGSNSIGQVNGTFITAGADPVMSAGGKIDAANGIITINGTYRSNSGSGDYASGSATNTFFNSGAVFEIAKSGGSFPAANWASDSYARATSTEANSSPPSFNGTSYANLEINYTNLISPISFNKNISFNNVNLINTGAKSVVVKNGVGTIPYTLTINGNLIVSSSSIMDLAANTSYGDSSGNMKVKGNIINDGMIRGNGGTSGNGNRLWFNGTVSQTIAGSGTWLGSNLYLVMNNAAGVTLISPLLLKGRIVFNIGNIRTDATNILTFAKGDTYSAGWLGASATSFVEGPMRNVSTGTWITFPVGKAGIYAPIGYYHVLNHLLTDTFRAEYFHANPQAIYGTNYDAAGNPEVIHHISNVEYWSLTWSLTTGTFASNSIEPHVMTSSYCQDISNTFTARFDPVANKWKNIGTAYRNLYSLGPPFVTGYLQSNFASGGIFTLATNSAANILGIAESPLPIHLIKFDAEKINSSKSLASWQLADFSSPGEKFEVQRAGDDKNFVTIGAVSGNRTDRFYNYTDNDLKTGVSYYRLKMIDEDGKITYSRTVAVMNGVNGLLLTSLIPTVVTNTSVLTIASSKREKLDLVIMDMQGRVVQKQNHSVAAGNTNIELPLSGLAAGVYQLTGISTEGRTNTIRFIKQ